MDIRSIGKVEGADQDGKTLIGARVRVKVVKNKIAPPFKTAEFDIMYDKGISIEGEIVDLATKFNIVRKAGSFFSYKDQKIGQGRENVKEFLNKNKKIAKELEKEIKAEFKKRADSDIQVSQTIDSETGEIESEENESVGVQ